jgi:hypothetical protein
VYECLPIPTVTVGAYVHMEYTIHLDPQIYFAVIAIGIYYFVKAVNNLFLPYMITSTVASIAKSSS